MDLRQLRYFTTIAAQGSFNRASSVLRIAQPALSRQIRELEAGLGATVFVRTTSGVRLTPAGEALLSEAQRLLPQFELAATRVQRVAAGQSGVVQVALSLPGAQIEGPVAAFADARRAMPDVDFRLNVVNSEEQVDLIRSGAIDVGLMFSSKPFPQGVRCLDIRAERIKLLVPVGHPLTQASNLRLADLRDYDLVFPPYEEAAATYNLLMAACLNGGLTPRVVISVLDPLVLAHLVSENVAISLCIPMVVEAWLGTRLTLLDIEDLQLSRHLVAIWNAERETPPLLRFLELVQARLGRAGD